MRLTHLQRKKLASLTPFQRSVLLACSKIPKGQTRNYSQIAQAVGKPKAARAVGNALANNPFPLIIPCHRVIRKNGKAGGYSAKGGESRKMFLLMGEFRSI